MTFKFKGKTYNDFDCSASNNRHRYFSPKKIFDHNAYIELIKTSSIESQNKSETMLCCYEFAKKAKVFHVLNWRDDDIPATSTPKMSRKNLLHHFMYDKQLFHNNKN